MLACSINNDKAIKQLRLLASITQDDEGRIFGLCVQALLEMLNSELPKGDLRCFRNGAGQVNSVVKEEALFFVRLYKVFASYEGPRSAELMKYICTDSRAVAHDSI